MQEVTTILWYSISLKIIQIYEAIDVFFHPSNKIVQHISESLEGPIFFQFGSTKINSNTAFIESKKFTKQLKRIIFWDFACLLWIFNWMRNECCGLYSITSFYFLQLKFGQSQWNKNWGHPRIKKVTWNLFSGENNHSVIEAWVLIEMK